MKVKIMATLLIDPEEYPIPVDGFIDPEIEDAMNDFIHDVDGIRIRNMKIITQE